jgi:hypothetical protein
MKKMLISEDEKSRILNLHQNLGYKTSLNEQVSPQQPQPNVQKPVESVNPYFENDPIGIKIKQKNPAFAKWITNNKIQTSRAKFDFHNDSTLIATGTNGRQYYLNLNYFNDNTPQSFVGANKKAVEIRQKLIAKINELNPKTGPYGSATIEKIGCFDVKTGMVNQNNSNNRECSIAVPEFNKYRNELGADSIGNLSQFESFASVAPKFQPKQG